LKLITEWIADFFSQATSELGIGPRRARPTTIAVSQRHPPAIPKPERDSRNGQAVTLDEGGWMWILKWLGCGTLYLVLFKATRDVPKSTSRRAW
jgi:hypothetical protein